MGYREEFALGEGVWWCLGVDGLEARHAEEGDRQQQETLSQVKGKCFLQAGAEGKAPPRAELNLVALVLS